MWRSRGFTLTELVAVIVIAVILAVFAAPRFFASGFYEARLFDETTAALRYAQRTAIATQRNVCAQFTSTQVTLTYASAYGAASACDTNLIGPGGASAPFRVTAQGGATFSAFPGTPVTFDRTGRPNAAQTITVSSGRQILVEAESGYVH